MLGPFRQRLRLSPLAAGRGLGGRRTFLNLGDILPNPLGPSKPVHYTEQQVLQFSPEQIFKVVVDVDKYHKFVPWCTKSVVYHQQVSLANRPSIVPEARGLVVPSRRVPADLEVGYSAFQERYTSMVTSEEPWRVEALSHNSNLFRELRTTWEFIPLSAVPAPQLRALRYDPKLYHSMGQDGSGACLVRFHIKFQFTSELYSRVSQMFFDGVCKEMVNAFKNRCRQVYHRPAARP